MNIVVKLSHLDFTRDVIDEIVKNQIFWHLGTDRYISYKINCLIKSEHKLEIIAKTLLPDYYVDKESWIAWDRVFDNLEKIRSYNSVIFKLYWWNCEDQLKTLRGFSSSVADWINNECLAIKYTKYN